MLSSLAASALFILLTCALGAAARALVRHYLRRGLLRSLAENAFTAAELCGCSFELSVVVTNFGVPMYAVFLFVLTIWRSASWGSASACPYLHLEDLVMGDTDLISAALKTCAELAGGVLVFQYVWFYWSLELVDVHVGRSLAECQADLNVPMLTGAAIEGIGTFAVRVVHKALSYSDPNYARPLYAFFAVSLIVAAMNFTGGFFNPVLASSRKFGCRGATNLEHAVVYWVGPCLGAVASLCIKGRRRPLRTVTFNVPAEREHAN